MGIDDLSKAFASFGVTAEQANENLKEMLSKMPPPTEEDILLVKANPNLSLLQKYRIVKSMKKLMKGDKKDGIC